MIFKHQNARGTKNGTQAGNAKRAREVWPHIAEIVGVPVDLPVRVSASTSRGTGVNIRSVTADGPPSHPQGPIVYLRELTDGRVPRVVAYLTDGATLNRHGVHSVDYPWSEMRVLSVVASADLEKRLSETAKG